MPNRTLAPKHSFSVPKTKKIPQNLWTPNWVVFTRFQAKRVLAMGDISGHPLDTRAGQGGGARRGDLARKFSRPTAAERARNGQANAAAAATMGHRILLFSGHSRPTHAFLPPFLDPLNSFPWSFSSDSSPFERYDENKFGQRLDLVFRPPQQILDQGKGIDVFLVSWAFR